MLAHGMTPTFGVEYFLALKKGKLEKTAAEGRRLESAGAASAISW